MISRLSAGIAGLVILVLAFTWPQLFRSLSNELISTIGGLLTAAIAMFGVYLLFYSLTGDWLPKLRKTKGNG